ncbi:S8 family serine peptidase [Methylobacterium sp. CB376]|uniref:S8 family serine peptidase n=1 Tax=unclassified Methylobacterium TaxID=2615210 RepID=UPI000152CECB|nr:MULTISPECIES: S8 family serine peptidase [Methylobacterium]WFT77135.1 S8 family serine peptidase [Methylobacterium nodulans]
MHPNDPYYAQQWYLRAIGNIEAIWDDYDGTDIHVGVFDDGIDFTHPDLKEREDRSRPILVPGPYDGVTTYSGWHGTEVAGVIAASGNNGEGGVGVAYGAALTQIDLNRWGPPIGVPHDVDGDIAAMRACAQYDVINFSGQPSPLWLNPNANLNDPTSDTARFDQAFDVVSRTGRGGLGTPIIQSAGNDDGINANGSGGNASRYTVTVAATDFSNRRAEFSNYGSSVLVTAPGTGLITTDMPGSKGDSPGSYMAFTGTSAPAPVVSGVVALMLQANPGLGWRDVQTILAASATHLGSAIGQAWPNGWEHGVWQINRATTWNGGGMHVHTDFGYGKVNVFGAVRMAEAWHAIGAPAQTSANEITVRSGELFVGEAIPDSGTLASTFDLTDDVVLDHVDLKAASRSAIIGICASR